MRPNPRAYKGKVSSPAIDKIVESLPKIGSLEEYGNYVDQNPFSSDEQFSPSFSLDYLRIFIKPSDCSQKDIPSLLHRLFAENICFRRNKSYFTFTFNNTDYNIHLRYSILANYYIGFVITLYQPDKALLEYFHNELKVPYHVSATEFSVDIRSDKPSELFGLLFHTMTARWSGKLLEKTYDTTIYANNIRFSNSKGLKAYLRDIDGNVDVRIEMTLKRRYLRNRGFRNIVDIMGMTADEAFKHIAFSNLKVSTIRKKILKRSKIEFPDNIHTIKISSLAVPFYHAFIDTEIQSGAIGIRKKLENFLTRGVYTEEHPFQSRFFEAVDGQLFV